MGNFVKATGAAFNLAQLFYNFDYKKLKITSTECNRYFNNAHRDILVTRVFKSCVQLVIRDIIQNNITFILPLRGNKKCNIHMQRIRGSSFKNLRRNGKWRDVDIINSNFTGYQLGVYLLGNRTPRIKNIYVSKYLSDEITKKTNEGFQYGDSKHDKKVEDYCQDLKNIYPKVSLSDLKRIVSFGWRNLYLLLSYGGDVCISDQTQWYYFGNLRKDSIKFFNDYVRKLSLKIRILYKRKKIEWDNYYYFALTDQQYAQYCSQKNTKGRPKRKFKFENIMMYQIFDECKVSEHEKKYIFKIFYPYPINYKFYKKSAVFTDPELVIEREPLKFKDVLIQENKYDVI